MPARRALEDREAVARRSFGAGSLRRAPRPGLRRPRVSVLVPTRNAGPRFAETLEAIRGQAGVRLEEVLVTDSGSTDGTVDVALEHGARVERIEPEAFDHGRTRDELAARSVGDLLVMMVQDAVPGHAGVLRELTGALRRDPSLAAVSAWQLPRSDADLHTRWEAWNRARSLRASGATLPRRRTLRRQPAPARPASKRERRLAKASLDDVCAVIRRSAWEQVRFRPTEFAEDLDFALRAREHGWTSRFAPAAPVVHSHDRGAVYLLCRHAVSVWVTAELLGERRRRTASAHGLADAAAAIRGVLPDLEGALEVAVRGDGGFESLALARLTERAAGHLRAGVAPSAPSGGLAELEEFLSLTTPMRSAGEPELLRERLVTALEWPPLAEFAAMCPEPLSPAAGHRFVSHLVAARLGQTLAAALREEPDSPLGRRVRTRVGARLTGADRPTG